MTIGINKIAQKITKELSSKLSSELTSKSGFTLVELMISLIILAIAVLSIGSIIISATRNGSLARNTTLACNLCQTKIEALKSLGFGAINNSQESNINEKGKAGGIFNRSVTVAAGTIPDTKVITVTVSWNDFLKTRTVSVRTQIANI